MAFIPTGGETLTECDTVRPYAHCLRCVCLAPALRYCCVSVACVCTHTANISAVALPLPALSLCGEFAFEEISHVTFFALVQSKGERERERVQQETISYLL